MKKKIVAILLCIFTLAGSLTFGGCLKSCFKVPTPKKEDITLRLKNLWNIELSDKYLTLANYAISVGPRGDGDWLYVFDYFGEDFEFNSLLNIEKNEEFESEFIGLYKILEDDFIIEFALPNFDTNYSWLYLEKSSHDGSLLMDIKLYVIYFSKENKLLIEFYKL